MPLGGSAVAWLRLLWPGLSNRFAGTALDMAWVEGGGTNTIEFLVVKCRVVV